MRAPRFTPIRWIACLGALAAAATPVGGCSDDDSGSDTTVDDQDPPTLEIVKFLTNDGVTHAADVERITLPCDRTLIVSVGPNPSPGLLENWVLRPPDACGSLAQCGYLLARFDPTDDGESVRVSAAQTNLSLDLGSVNLAGEHRIRVELRQGETGKVFVDEDESPVFAEATVSFDPVDCPSGIGGAGGASGGLGGADGSGGSVGGLGGAGGLGGFGGSG